MAVSLRESAGLIADPGNLDACVGELFALMLGGGVRRDERPAVMDASSVTAVVGFGGALSGACILRASGEAARLLAGRLTGMEFVEVDETVEDGLGELCNMVAGSWKGKVPELAAHCGLSVPAVITGRDYRLRVPVTPAFILHHVYGFENIGFEITIVCDGLQ